MKPILGNLLPVDVENEDFWTDLENFYLPNGDLNMATADDWRTAYIMVILADLFLFSKHFFSSDLILATLNMLMNSPILADKLVHLSGS